MLIGLLGCLAAGVALAAGHASLAAAATVLAVLGTLTLVEPRRVSLFLWAGVAFTAPMQGVRAAPLLALSDVLLVAAFVATLPEVVHRARTRLPRGLVVAFATLVASGLLGTFFAADTAASLVNLLKIVLAAAGSVAAMALWDPEPGVLRRFAWLWLAGATTSAAWGVVAPPTAGRALGLTTHPNHFGLACVLAIGLGLGLALSSTGWGRAAALASTALLTAGVGLSGSRAAVLALAVTVGATAVLTRKLRLLVATGVLTSLGAMAVVAGIVHLPSANALARLAGGGGSAESDQGRRQVIAEALATIDRHPFTGEGFEFAQAAHNIYLQALVVGGPIALLSFLCVSWLIVRAGLRAIPLERDRPNGPLLAGLTAGYISYLVSGAFDNILWDRYLWTYIGLLLVLAGRITSAEPRAADPAPSADQALPVPR